MNLKETAKELQKSYRSNILRHLKDTIINLDCDYDFRDSKISRTPLLIKLKKCLLISDNKPTVDLKDVYNLLRPFYFSRRTEDRVTQLIKIRIPTLDYISKDLSFLEKEFNGVRFHKDSLFVTTHNVTLKDIDLGSFDMELNLNREIPTYHGHMIVSVNALNPNYPVDNDYNSHPHIERNSLCTGDNRRIVFLALREFRLLDYFQMVNSILNTYGSNPYIKLSLWYTEKCDDCDWRDHDNTTCTECDRGYCHSCIRSCAGCDDYYCISCIGNVCNCCENWVCSGCKIECNCDREVCPDCKIRCSCCDNEICLSCKIICNCDREVCPDCQIKCSGCNSTCCQKCIKECSDCSDQRCSACPERCEDCEEEHENFES